MAVPAFHQWNGAYNNPELLALDERSAMLFYSDFYYPDKYGVKRKSILCRRITVVDGLTFRGDDGIRAFD